MIGQIIDGRYQLLEKLREQRFYVVYGARLVNTDTRAIVKLIRPEYVMPGETFERLRPNLAVVASLRHSGIAHLREFGEDRTIYLAEEYYEGTLLNTILESGSNLNTLQTLELCIRILEALSHAHAKGIVHGLLSPESVVVLGNLSVKISDFYSLAAITAPLGLSSDRPGRDTRYGSPESLAGLAVTFQSDIYSAGVIIYQLMTARLPFTGKQALENAIERNYTSPPPPQEINPAVSPLLSSVILKAIKPQTSARYATASEFLSELHLCRSSLMRSMSEQQFMAGEAAPAAVVPPPMTPASAPPLRKPEPVYARPQQPAPPPPQRTEPPIRQPVDARGIAASLEFEEDLVEKRAMRLRQGLLIGGAALFLTVVIALASFFYKSIGGGVKATDRQEITVPDVVGKQETEARSLLGRNKLEVQVEREPSSEVEKDIVIRQTPEPGKSVKQGRVVTIFISLGEEDIEIPDVLKMTRTDAEEILRRAGFRIKIREEFDDKIHKNYVIDQLPAAGKKLPPESSVTLIVSKGAEPVAMPSLVGKHIDDAKAALEKLKIPVGEVQSVESDAQEPDHVVKQSVAAKTKLDIASMNPVVLTIAKSGDAEETEEETVEETEEPVEEPPVGETTTKTINFTVPEDGRVTVYVVDSASRTRVYDQEHSEGDSVVISDIEVTGSAHYTVFIDNRPVLKRNL